MSVIVHVSDPNTLLVVECASLGVQVRTSRVEHPETGIGISAAKKFWKGERIGTYYGTALYDDLGRESQRKKTYMDIIMGVKVADFEKWSLEFYNRVEHGTTGSLSVLHCPGQVL